MPRKPQPKEFLVYGLIDPLTQQLRYVGKSSNGMLRPKEHMHKSNMTKPFPSSCWIRSLSLKGLKPEIFVIERCIDNNCALECEAFWIAYFKSIGCKLLNVTPGGTGIIGMRITQEWRQKLSDAMKKYQASRSEAARKEALKIQIAKPEDPEWIPAYKRKPIKTKRRSPKSIEERIALSRKKGGGPVQDQFGTIYPNASMAAEHLNINRSNMSQHLRGKRKWVKGFIFTYVEEV